jgi:hypothetical protein
MVQSYAEFEKQKSTRICENDLCPNVYRPSFRENKPKTGSINSGTEKFVCLLRESASGWQTFVK